MSAQVTVEEWLSRRSICAVPAAVVEVLVEILRPVALATCL